MKRDMVISFCDKTAMVFLCFSIFCLPFAKAGVESFVWPAIFLFILKRLLGYRAGSLWAMLPRTVLNNALVFFIVANLLSVIFSVNFGLSLRGFLGKELKFVAIFFMTVEFFNNKERLKFLLITIISSAALILVDAGVQYFRGVDFLRGYQYSRLTASFSAANGFAAWILVIIPLIAGIFFSGKIIHRKLNNLLLVMIVMFSVCLLITYSRGAWLAITISGILMSYYILRSASLKARIRYLCFIVCLLVIFLFVSKLLNIKMQKVEKVNFDAGQTVGERIKSVVQINEGASLVRINLWKESLRIFKDHPFTGCGLNTYSIVVKVYKSFSGGGIYPHNSYLQMLAETGLFGLFAFLWLLFVFFKTGILYLSKKRDYLVSGFLAGVLAFLVHSLVDNHLYSLQLVVLLWFMFGLVTAIINLETDFHQNLGG